MHIVGLEFTSRSSLTLCSFPSEAYDPQMSLILAATSVRIENRLGVGGGGNPVWQTDHRMNFVFTQSLRFKPVLRDQENYYL